MKFIKKILAFSLFVSCLIEVTGQDSITPTSVTNCNICDGTATLTTTQNGFITFSWYNINDNFISSETNNLGTSTITNQCAGVFYVTILNSNNETNTTIFNIDTDITSNFQAQEINICNNDETYDLNSTIPVAINSNGIWTNTENEVIFPNLIGNIDNPITGGNYFYTIDEAVCSVTSMIQLNVNSIASSGLSTTYLICENYPPFLMTDFLGGIPDYGGDWYDSSNTITSSYFDAATQDSEIFTYFIDTVEGCTPVLSTLFVVENLLPNPGIPTEITICETAPILNLTDQLNGNPELNGNWLDDSFNPVSNIYNAALHPPGVFSYFVSGNTPCPTLQTQLTINYSEGVTSGNGSTTAYCEDNSFINLYGLIDSYSPGGFFTDPQNIETDSLVQVNSSNSGSYLYTVSQEGCTTQSSEINLTFESTYELIEDTVFTLCETIENYDLNQLLTEIDVLNGNWTLNNELLFSPEIESNLLQNIFIYQTNNLACPNQQFQAEITLDEFLFAGNDSTITICQSDVDFSLFDLLSNQSNNDGFWSFNNSNTSTVFSPSNTPPGQYLFTLNPQNQCPSSSSIIDINVTDSILTASLPDIETCGNSSLIELGESPIANYTYEWTTNESISDHTISNPLIDLSSFALTTVQSFYLTISHDECQKNITQNVTIHANPYIVSVDTASGCSGQEILLTVDSDSPVNWMPENMFSLPNNDVQFISLNQSIPITVEATNEYGCTSSTNIYIDISPSPQINYEISDYNDCVPVAINFFNTSSNLIPTEYVWQFSTGEYYSENNITLFFENPIILNYSITATSENGCQSQLSSLQPIEIFKTPHAIFSFDSDHISIFNSEIELENQSLFATDYIWTIDDNLFSIEENPTLLLPVTGGQNYLICLETINNSCWDTTCKNAYIPVSQSVFVPNSFTPNDDGTNDIFKPIISNMTIKDYSLRIYNRWGSLVYESKDENQGWNGDTRTNNFYYGQNETYTWKLIITQKENIDEQYFIGKVTLIR